ncbi:MAG: M48 family metallopeptidase [Prevotella sp.]|jgi:heat shock protein HtpX|nr:M48 family metallopeptidase [Prevotella sp.]MBQ1668563.1 M48 family metallopeptidase [Prevotella sp.]MBQ1702431.1 M48 family metallopeptidase [Prevotella sp.]MBQ1760008.1 M48 family metallopeptidase [Prevotella sp.]MBQ2216946.1 M48 family metallopeptidase [Prevotella sp.]
MKYVGIQTQIQRNNMMSILLLLMFPIIILGMIWVFLALINYFGNGYYNDYGELVHQLSIDEVNYYFITTIPWVIVGVGIWFCIAYFSNTSMIRNAVGAQSVTRMENPRLYNIVENLCMTCNMEMPKINIVNDPGLNAFASGIDNKSYTVTVTTGLMNLLNDQELAGVIGHELTHIRNRDTRLLITSIIFVGIVSTIMSMALRMMNNVMVFGRYHDNDRDGRGSGLSFWLILIVGIICTFIAYIFTLITRFAISRKREYMADAGGAELCGDPLALASALRKISGNPGLGSTKREDVAQLFIIHPKDMESGFMNFMNSLFSTHPDTEKRIAILEQF